MDPLPGDRFLLCSDGVTGGIWDRAVGEFLQNESVAEPIVGAAVQAYGHDNATAMVTAVGAA